MGVTSTCISRFVDLSSMNTLTHILDLEYVCGTGNSIHHCSISHIIQKGIGVCFTVITSIVTGHKSVSVILWKLK